MNIKYLQDLLSRIDEIKVIGKSKKIKGVICNIAGLVRYGSKLRLIILEYDEQYSEKLEEREIAEICGDIQIPETNRTILKSREEPTQPFRFIEEVILGDNKLRVNGTESRRLSVQDGESILFLSELLRSGWRPEGIEYQNIDMLFLTSIELDGDFDKIPNFDNNNQIRFIVGWDTSTYLLEKPITLLVGGEYTDKLWFKNKDTSKEYWAQINRVYLMDMWDEMEKTFSNPKLLEHMTKEEIPKAKKDFEEKFLQICPKGMYYPVVEYESEEDISLQFYTKQYLDSLPANNNGGIGFIIRPEKSTGILGEKLKVAIIQEPVPANTTTIEAELFQYSKTSKVDDIII